MSKKVLSAFVILAICVMINNSVFASSTQLKQTQDNKAKLQAKVNQLNAQIDSVINKINNNKAAMNKIAKEIEITEEKLKDAENASKSQNELYKSRVRAMYINGTNGYLQILLTSNSLSDFISRLDTITRIIKFDTDVLNKLKENEQAISEKKQSLIAENNRLKKIKETNQSILSKLNSDIQAQKILLANTSQKEEELLAQENSKQVALNSASSSNFSGVTLSRGSGLNSVSKVISVNATAYSISGITANGMKTSKGIIAVDPRVIPLGSRVYIEGYGYAIAADTGGAIKGNRVDLFFPSNSDAQNWGMKSVNLYILK
ncbi:3D domain-containing protein [Clostridium sp.]|jgi:peptidoglycan DL-endopeptidase CwlO|uniref:3D domain-containing protein n=1 Tax=Clostridium sp. TaxID=1506 RepID=UPI003A5C65E3